MLLGCFLETIRWEGGYGDNNGLPRNDGNGNNGNDSRAHNLSGSVQRGSQYGLCLLHLPQRRN